MSMTLFSTSILIADGVTAPGVVVAGLSTLATSTSYANDTAAAAGGVQIGQIYRNGNFLQVRLT